jgi:hypothetical protein
MEANFNATSKAIYGMCMLANVRKYNLMPEEVYNERNCLVDDETLSKVLFYNIVQQLRRPTVLVSVDADNRYDRIAHPMASMVFQSFGVPTPAIELMLTTIQNIVFPTDWLWRFCQLHRRQVQQQGGSSENTGNVSREWCSPQGMDSNKHPNDCRTQMQGSWSSLYCPHFGHHRPHCGRSFCRYTDLVHVDM